jgi:hypothetical protein
MEAETIAPTIMEQIITRFGVPDFKNGAQAGKTHLTVLRYTDPYMDV